MIYKEYTLDFLYKDFDNKDTILYRAYFRKQDDEGGSSCDRCTLKNICEKNSEEYGVAIKDKHGNWKYSEEVFCGDIGDLSKETICVKLEKLSKIEPSEKYIISVLNSYPKTFNFGNTKKVITPKRIIEDFCKNFCPLHNKTLKCRDNISCPFYNIFNEVGTHIIHLPNDK